MKNDEKLMLAVKAVNEAIVSEEKRLHEIANGAEQDPILIEGETETGYYCQMMVDPKIVAEIFLRYEYPIWNVLEQDAPTTMWDNLAREFGLKTVSSVDL